MVHIVMFPRIDKLIILTLLLKKGALMSQDDSRSFEPAEISATPTIVTTINPTTSSNTNPHNVGSGLDKLSHIKKKKKKKRWRIDYSGLRAVTDEQKRSQFKPAIPRVAIRRVFREYTDKWTRGSDQFRLSKAAVSIVHEVAEDYLISIMQASALCTVHAKRKTTFRADMKLATDLIQGRQLAVTRATWPDLVKKYKKKKKLEEELNSDTDN